MYGLFRWIFCMAKKTQYDFVRRTYGESVKIGAGNVARRRRISDHLAEAGSQTSSEPGVPVGVTICTTL